MSAIRKGLAVGAALATALALSACGSRLPKSEVISAAAVQVQVGSGTGAVAGTGNQTTDGSAVTGNTAPGADGQQGQPLAQGGTTGDGTAPGGTTSGGTTGSGATSNGTSGRGTSSGNTGSSGSGSQGTSSGNRRSGGTGSGGTTSGPATKSTINLGNIATYSGPVGNILVSLRPMIGVWQNWVNAHGGLNGHKVNVIIADDGGDPSKALTEAKKMVEKDHILAFFDPYLLFDFPPFTKYAASVNIPIIGGDGTQPPWQTTKITFPVTAPAGAIGYAGNRYFAQHGVKKIGVVYCVDSVQVCGGINDGIHGSTKKTGVDIVYNAGVSITAPSFTSQCINAKNAGAEGLWLLLDGASVQRLIKDCAAQGYHPMLEPYSLALSPVTTTWPELQGSFLPVAVFPTAFDGTPAAKQYHQAAQQYAPNLGLDQNTAGVWASGELLRAASKYLSDKPTTAELFKGLYSIKNNTLGGLTIPLTFNKGGTAKYVSCAFVAGIKNNKFTAPQGNKAVC